LQNSTTKKPLIRLKVDYTGCEPLNHHRIGQGFVGKVANPDDMINNFKKKKNKPVHPRVRRPMKMKF